MSNKLYNTLLVIGLVVAALVGCVFIGVVSALIGIPSPWNMLFGFVLGYPIGFAVLFAWEEFSR